MIAAVGAPVAGGLAAALVLTLGATAAAWLAIAIALLVIIAGAVDYARTHG